MACLVQIFRDLGLAGNGNCINSGNRKGKRERKPANQKLLSSKKKKYWLVSQFVEEILVSAHYSITIDLLGLHIRC